MTVAADRPAVGSGKTDAGLPAAARRLVTSLAGLLLLVAVAAGLLRQGAFYASVQRLVGLLVAAAVGLALVAAPPTRRDARFLAIPTLALVAWAILDAALLGVSTGGAVRLALSLLGIVGVLLVCRRLLPEDRDALLIGVTVIGLLVALTGWLGVAARISAWAWQGDGIWRASSTVSYPNATAAVLVPLAVLVLARLTGTPRSVPLAVAASGLLAGVGATMSRAGAVGLAVGLIVLACVQGPSRTARAAVGPCTGALVALGCLVPSMPAAHPPRPVLALVGLLIGLTLAAVAARLPRRSAAAALLCTLLGGGVAALIIGGQGSRVAVATVTQSRMNLASPDRSGAWRAALQLTAAHPLTGTGPGHADLRWRGSDGVLRFFGYAHNEYLQTAAELGLVGLALLAIMLVTLARVLGSARAACPNPAVWAGVVAGTAAFAVHSGFDFIWHLPAVVLTILLLTGAVLPTLANADTPPVFRFARRESDENQLTN